MEVNLRGLDKRSEKGWFDSNGGEENPESREKLPQQGLPFNSRSIKEKNGARNGYNCLSRKIVIGCRRRTNKRKVEVKVYAH